MAPEIPLGTLVVKLVEATEGDAVEFEFQGLRIQGQWHPVRYPHRERLKDRALPQGTRLIVPERAVWVMGDHPRSFDSRYFGPIEDPQIIGVAHALPF
jgi:conjugal transfer pilin signal peptidase TrbI